MASLGDIYIVEKKSYQMLAVIVKPNEISITQYNLREGKAGRKYNGYRTYACFGEGGYFSKLA